jgi:hypothetical protein
MAGEFREPRPEIEKEKEILKIEVPELEAEKFRMEKAYNEALGLLNTLSYSEHIKMLEITAEIKDPDKLHEYLKQNEPQLSEVAKFFLKVVIERRKIERQPISSKEKTVTLWGKEAEEFEKYRAYYEEIEKDIKK